MRDSKNPNRRKKWGAYALDREDFEFARDGAGEGRTPEAELMDWADDIAYSVHDLEDFHRCGVLPWQNILDGGHHEKLVARTQTAWFGAPLDAGGRLRGALRNLETLLMGAFGDLLTNPYEGSRDQRQQLRTMTSVLIGRYINATSIKSPSSNGDDSIIIGTEEADEVRILKQITRDYIISNPSLAAQQKGHKRILETLFESIFEDSSEGPPPYLPRRLTYLWGYAGGRARFAADCVASLTEAEAVGLHGRLQGLSSGSVLDPIVR